MNTVSGKQEEVNRKLAFALATRRPRTPRQPTHLQWQRSLVASLAGRDAARRKVEEIDAPHVLEDLGGGEHLGGEVDVARRC